MPVTIRRRTSSEVKVYVYRIDRGATCLYKCEAVLTGKRRNRSVFGTDDIEVIDAVLRELVDTCDLHPLHKPVRWEPRSFNTDLELGDFDEALRKLPQKAWRGVQLAPSWVKEAAKCHNPDAVVLIDAAVLPGTIPQESSIRTHIDHPPAPVGVDVGPPSPLPELDDLLDGKEAMHPLVAAYQPTRWSRSLSFEPPPRRSFDLDQRGAWKSLTQEFQRLPSGLLVEVVLDGNCDPGLVIDAIVADDRRTVGVSHLCHRAEGSHPPTRADLDAWGSVLDAMVEHPVTADTDTWVVVIDTSTVMAVRKWVAWQVANYGSLGDGIPRVCRSVAAWLWDWFRAYREACEVSGLTLVVVSTDTRPDHGRGPLLRTHFFKDPRVRSWLGDAGRYHAHQRYLVEPDAKAVVALKDEVEGLPGRRLYRSPTVSL